MENKSCPISIACGADDKFAMGLAVTLYSALANLEVNRPIDIYIIDGGISEQNKNRLTKALSINSVSVSLKWIEPDLELLDGMKVTRALSTATFFRLLLPELLPAQLDRIIYLDSDLVIEGNLLKLWQEELGNRPALAVQDYHYLYVSNGLNDRYQELGLAPDTPYCNAGVMLINLKQWRIELLHIKMLEYARKYHKIDLDQNAINAIIPNRWKPLDPKWNVQIFGVDRFATSYLYDPKDLVRNAFILHFTTPLKPWHPSYRQVSAGRFAHYLRKCNWFNNREYMKWFVTVRLPQMFIYLLAKIKRGLL